MLHGGYPPNGLSGLLSSGQSSYMPSSQVAGTNGSMSGSSSLPLTVGDNGSCVDSSLHFNMCSSQTSQEDRSKTNLIINYLPQTFEQTDLFDLFSQVGPIKQCKLIREKTTGASLCYGFVDFQNPVHAASAIKMFHTYEINHKRLRVAYASAGAKGRMRSGVVSSSRLSNGLGSSIMSGGRLGGMGSNGNSNGLGVGLQSSSDNMGWEVCVMGVPLTVTEFELQYWFSKFGSILQLRLFPPLESSSQGTGSLNDDCTDASVTTTATVTFDDRKSAERAVSEMNGCQRYDWPQPLMVRLIGPVARSSGLLHLPGTITGSAPTTSSGAGGTLAYSSLFGSQSSDLDSDLTNGVGSGVMEDISPGTQSTPLSQLLLNTLTDQFSGLLGPGHGIGVGGITSSGHGSSSPATSPSSAGAGDFLGRGVQGQSSGAGMLAAASLLPPHARPIVKSQGEPLTANARVNGYLGRGSSPLFNNADPLACSTSSSSGFQSSGCSSTGFHGNSGSDHYHSQQLQLTDMLTGSHPQQQRTMRMWATTDCSSSANGGLSSESPTASTLGGAKLPAARPSIYVRTPLLQSHILSNTVARQQGNARVYLKMENCQPSGSFKLRGMANLCRMAVLQGYTRLISSSGGNAGLAAAYAGRELGLPVVVVVPQSTPPVTRSRLEEFGAQVVVHGADWSEAHHQAVNLATGNCLSERTRIVHPFDHTELWNGYESLVDELAEDLPHQPDVILLAVGGGGLLNGIIQGLWRRNWVTTQLVTVETEGTNCLAQSVAAGRHLHLPAVTGVATSLGAPSVSTRTWELIQIHGVYAYACSDKEAVNAVSRFLDDHGTLVEPACGAALSAIYSGQLSRLQLEGRLPQTTQFGPAGSSLLAVVIVCGGSGVNRQLLTQWEHDLAVSSTSVNTAVSNPVFFPSVDDLLLDTSSSDLLDTTIVAEELPLEHTGDSDKANPSTDNDIAQTPPV